MHKTAVHGKALEMVVTVRPSTLQRVFIVLCMIAIAILAGTWGFLEFYWGLDVPWEDAPPIKHLLVQFHLGIENVFAAWFSSMLLLIVALSFLGAYAIDRKMLATVSPLSLIWVILATMFAGLSVDELGSVHERISMLSIGGESQDGGAQILSGWQLLMVVLGGGILMIVWFSVAHVRRVRAAFWLMVAGAVCYLSIPFQEYVEVGIMWAAAGEGWRRPVWLLLLEEGTELAGTLLFLASALTYVVGTVERSGYERDQVIIRVDRQPAILVTVSISLIALVGMVLATKVLGPMGGDKGVPINWFAAAFAFLAFLLSTSLVYRRQQLIYGLIALLSLTMSVIAGAHLYKLGGLGQGWSDPTLTQIARWIISGGVLGLIALVLVGGRFELIRVLGIGSWLVMMMVGLHAHSAEVGAGLIAAAFACMVVALVVDHGTESARLPSRT